MVKRFTTVAAICILLAACAREAHDDSGPPLPTYRGPAVPAVGGVQVGETLSAAEARLGPSSPTGPGSTSSMVWQVHGQVIVEIDASRTITRVYGKQLKAGSDTLVYVGQPFGQVQKVLGEPTVKSRHMPAGSGVISTGMKFAGQEASYERDGVRYVFVFDKDKILTGMWATRASAKAK
jgi:hypothetical protein